MKMVQVNELDLKYLTETERDQILSVLRRDEDLQRQEEKRIRALQTEIQRIRKNSAIKPGDDPSKTCSRCHRKLGMIFDSGDLCPRCHSKVCEFCRESQQIGKWAGEWVCILCSKQIEFKAKTGRWFSDNLKKRFKEQDFHAPSELLRASINRSRGHTTSKSILNNNLASLEDVSDSGLSSDDRKQHSDVAFPREGDKNKLSKLISRKKLPESESHVEVRRARSRPMHSDSSSSEDERETGKKPSPAQMQKRALSDKSSSAFSSASEQITTQSEQDMNYYKNERNHDDHHYHDDERHVHYRTHGDDQNKDDYHQWRPSPDSVIENPSHSSQINSNLTLDEHDQPVVPTVLHPDNGSDSYSEVDYTDDLSSVGYDSPKKQRSPEHEPHGHGTQDQYCDHDHDEPDYHHHSHYPHEPEPDYDDSRNYDYDDNYHPRHQHRPLERNCDAYVLRRHTDGHYVGRQSPRSTNTNSAASSPRFQHEGFNSSSASSPRINRQGITKSVEHVRSANASLAQGFFFTSSTNDIKTNSQNSTRDSKTKFKNVAKQNTDQEHFLSQSDSESESDVRKSQKSPVGPTAEAREHFLSKSETDSDYESESRRGKKTVRYNTDSQSDTDQSDDYDIDYSQQEPENVDLDSVDQVHVLSCPDIHEYDGRIFHRLNTIQESEEESDADIDAIAKANSFLPQAVSNFPSGREEKMLNNNDEILMESLDGYKVTRKEDTFPSHESKIEGSLGLFSMVKIGTNKEANREIPYSSSASDDEEFDKLAFKYTSDRGSDTDFVDSFEVSPGLPDGSTALKENMAVFVTSSSRGNLVSTQTPESISLKLVTPSLHSNKDIAKANPNASLNIAAETEQKAYTKQQYTDSGSADFKSQLLSQLHGSVTPGSGSHVIARSGTVQSVEIEVHNPADPHFTNTLQSFFMATNADDTASHDLSTITELSETVSTVDSPKRNACREQSVSSVDSLDTLTGTIIGENPDLAESLDIDSEYLDNNLHPLDEIDIETLREHVENTKHKELQKMAGDLQTFPYIKKSPSPPSKGKIQKMVAAKSANKKSPKYSKNTSSTLPPLIEPPTEFSSPVLANSNSPEPTQPVSDMSRSDLANSPAGLSHSDASSKGTPHSQDQPPTVIITKAEHVQKHPVAQNSMDLSASMEDEPRKASVEEDIDEIFAAHKPSQHGSRSNLHTTSAVSVTSIYSEAGANYGRVLVTGDILFGLDYNYKSGVFEINIKKCQDLAAADAKKNRSDPYVKTYLLPNKTKASKRKTHTKKNNLDPVFDESLRYTITESELETRTLWVSVWHSAGLGRNDFLGEVMIPLEDYEFKNPTAQWHELQSRHEAPSQLLAYKGELSFAFKFVTQENIQKKKAPAKPKKKDKKPIADGEKGELHVLVKHAKDLTAVKSSNTSDPFCKGYLLPDRTKGGKQKTLVIKKNCNPEWNHTFIYDEVNVEELRECCLELTVWDFERLGTNDFLGGLRLSLGLGKSYGRVVDWMDSMGEEVVLWQSVLQKPNTWVEGTLQLRPSMDSKH